MIVRALDQPWLTYRLARFGELEITVFICEGTIAMHRHIEQDELFLVYDGEMVVQTEREDVELCREEMVRIPKGTAHQSRSKQRATVVLFRVSDDLVLHRNGRWRMFRPSTDSSLEKVNLDKHYAELKGPYAPAEVGAYEGWRLWLSRCAGTGPTVPASPAVTPLLVMRGQVTVRPARGGALSARKGDVVVIPADTSYHLETDTAAVLLTLVPGI
jgi:mannose-6-phosphate isomerase-like protein (cupin superfamily)